VSERPLVRVAAQNNAEWCDAFCHTHRVVGRLLVRWAPLLHVRVPVITLTPSGRQREPAPVARSGTCRAPSTTPSEGRPARGESRALSLCRRLRVSQAGPVSYFPQKTTSGGLKCPFSTLIGSGVRTLVQASLLAQTGCVTLQSPWKALPPLPARSSFAARAPDLTAAPTNTPTQIRASTASARIEPKNLPSGTCCGSRVCSGMSSDPSQRTITTAESSAPTRTVPEPSSLARPLRVSGHRGHASGVIPERSRRRDYPALVC
jgi:hypothetical protein